MKQSRAARYSLVCRWSVVDGQDRPRGEPLRGAFAAPPWSLPFTRIGTVALTDSALRRGDCAGKPAAGSARSSRFTPG